MLNGAHRRFASTQSGLAAIEFALILPVMVLLFIGAVQFTDYALCEQKVVKLASTAADLVTQGDVHDADTMTNVWQALNAVVYPYTPGGIKIVVSGLQYSNATRDKVSWGVASGGASPRAARSLMAVPDGISLPNTSTTGDILVVAEVTYAYKPLFGGFVMPKTVTIISTYYAAPRSRPAT
ncbi:MAG TPA: TadE/TadG family type IV pilus assembly protein [Rhizomicrobium sp.]|nr:TadE/TadG family type IV pilus assembly protein [Rhizomicrobium sp.]